MSRWEKEQGSKYRNDFNRKKYDRFSAMFPKGKKSDYMALADKLGLKLNTLINQLLEDKLSEELVLLKSTKSL